MRATFILIFASLLLPACTNTVAIGGMAPDFTIKDEAGKPAKLSDHRGNLVFLNFWATWCVPCQEEAADLESLNQEFRNRKFRMMTVSVDTEWDLVHTFNAKYKVDLPTYLDPGQQVARRYKVDKWPETFIIDRKGVILKHFWGLKQWPNYKENLEKMIKDQETALLQNDG